VPSQSGDDVLQQLLALVARLPGLGPRSARRVVLHLMKNRETALQPLVAALGRVEAGLSSCGICGNLDTRDPCRICTDPKRDATLLCVVADVADLWALERGRLFAGRYHVLGGTLSALDGVGPSDLSIGQLQSRVLDGVGEVVLAMNATLEGQTTAHFVAEALAGTGVRVTQLAHGVPVGGELDYLDEGTLAQALRLRRPV
jgi:recombination protein RecR